MVPRTGQLSGQVRWPRVRGAAMCRRGQGGGVRPLLLTALTPLYHPSASFLKYGANSRPHTY